ncbi:diacylglycerol/lipid kinase family protein [Candidatus Nanogingivalis gingivitcus]|jgi:hypothetical protein|uniref:DAGKc domain-containing protein n=1 Tax=Candidatus Nanogingivalis gingivitcus TaxID=2171992 RepID=A0ABY0FJC4_9BACT|nr:diacylglycerol kinase family protein [Candidatus Nanogingivalis gingivitcus]RYC73018.1 hypothetical protein G6CMJM_00123 [Candidatus Nanogingivalis gingivitcus]
MKKHLILVVNPRSSGFKLVEKKILSFLNNKCFNDDQLSVFEIQPTTPMENTQEMAKILHSGDIILVAGGDGTAHIASNAVAISGQKNIKMKFTGFGNFNDYAHSFSKNSGKAMLRAIESGKMKTEIHPLEIKINGKFFRYAPLYATIGLTAEMAEIFEGKKLRRVLKKIHRRNLRLILSLFAATRFYFKHRKKHLMKIESISLDDKEYSLPKKIVTDLVFMNGPRMARIMRSSANKIDNKNFGFSALNSANLIKNVPFLLSGIIGKIPLTRTKKVGIEFKKPRKITIQIEGEAIKVEKVSKIEVKICDNIKIAIL